MEHAFEVRTVTEQPVMFVRGPARHAEISQSIGRFIATVGRHVGSLGGGFAGPPYTRYHDAASDPCDLEAGAPVRALVAESDVVHAGVLPGGEALCATHLGAYDALPAVGAAMRAWCAEHGRTPSGPGWEMYMNDPTVVEQSLWRTDLFLPLAPQA